MVLYAPQKVIPQGPALFIGRFPIYIVLVIHEDKG